MVTNCPLVLTRNFSVKFYMLPRQRLARNFLIWQTSQKHRIVSVICHMQIVMTCLACIHNPRAIRLRGEDNDFSRHLVQINRYRYIKTEITWSPTLLKCCSLWGCCQSPSFCLQTISKIHEHNKHKEPYKMNTLMWVMSLSYKIAIQLVHLYCCVFGAKRKIVRWNHYNRVISCFLIVL